MFATVLDVAGWMGQDAPVDTLVISQWQRWLATIESDIRRRIPNLDRLVDGDPAYWQTVVDVQSAAVARMVDTYDAVAKQEKTTKIDDGTITRSSTLASWVIPGKLYLTDDEWDRLLPEPVMSAGSFMPSYVPGVNFRAYR